MSVLDEHLEVRADLSLLRGTRRAVVGPRVSPSGAEEPEIKLSTRKVLPKLFLAKLTRPHSYVRSCPDRSPGVTPPTAGPGPTSGAPVFVPVRPPPRTLEPMSLAPATRAPRSRDSPLGPGPSEGPPEGPRVGRLEEGNSGTEDVSLSFLGTQGETSLHNVKVFQGRPTSHYVLGTPE